MSWFRVDDQSPFHHKVIAAGNEAWGAFCRGGAIASGQRTDGFVADGVALLIAPESVWTRLVDSRLAHREEGGWRLHDYTDWNPSAKDVERLKKARAAAGKTGGRVASKSGAKRREHVEASAQAIASSIDQAKGSDRIGSGSGSSPDGGAGGATQPGLAEAIWAEIRRHRVFAPLDNEDSVQGIAMVAFNHARGPAEAAACIAEAAAKEGPRAATAGAQDAGSLASFVGGCIRRGSLRPPKQTNPGDKRLPNGRVAQGQRGLDEYMPEVR